MLSVITVDEFNALKEAKLNGTGPAPEVAAKEEFKTLAMMKLPGAQNILDNFSQIIRGYIPRDDEDSTVSVHSFYPLHKATEVIHSTMMTAHLYLDFNLMRPDKEFYARLKEEVAEEYVKTIMLAVDALRAAGWDLEIAGDYPGIAGYGAIIVQVNLIKKEGENKDDETITG